MTRQAYIQELSQRIGRRNLIWFGQAGVNARPLAILSQFATAYSLVAPAALPGHEVCLEQLTRERARQQGSEVRPDQSEQHRDFYHRLLASLGEPAVTVTHQASRFFASVYFLRRDYVEHLGLFHEQQEVFNHKPWVESALQRVGVRTVPWRYLATYDRPALIHALEQALRTGPIVLRANRSVSGRGLTLIRHPEEIPIKADQADPDGYVAVAPFLEPSVPLNVGACVFPDGTVSLHSPSLQLIGIPGSGMSTFTYCGNDFAQVRELDSSVLKALENMTILAGRWLSSVGYVGAFGVDALLHKGTVYLTEVNPRFQGSTLVSAHLDAALDRPDVLLTHAGAFLGLPAPDPLGLHTLAREQPPAAQIWVRNGHKPVMRNDSPWHPSEDIDCWLLPEPGVTVHPQALLGRLIVRHAVTGSGWELQADIAALFAGLPKMLFKPVSTPSAPAESAVAVSQDARAVASPLRDH